MRWLGKLFQQFYPSSVFSQSHYKWVRATDWENNWFSGWHLRKKDFCFPYTAQFKANLAQFQGSYSVNHRLNEPEGFVIIPINRQQNCLQSTNAIHFHHNFSLLFFFVLSLHTFLLFFEAQEFIQVPLEVWAFKSSEEKKKPQALKTMHNCSCRYFFSRVPISQGNLRS